MTNPVLPPHNHTNPFDLIDWLSQTERLLIIQDLDGVCMELVHDPMTRQLEFEYLQAATKLEGEFFVLTNGEHIGTRGVNRLVEECCNALDPSEQCLYLPGLAAGGVQYQTPQGEVSHPGVSQAELEFLKQVPERMQAWLRQTLQQSPLSLNSQQAETIVDACVLDNLVSPTLNLNVAYQALQGEIDKVAFLQQRAEDFCQQLLDQAGEQGLEDSFFVHLAPNLGRDKDGERLKPVTGTASDTGDVDPGAIDLGTTDFQFMLRGAVKEVGVLVLLNRYYHQLTGDYPLGEGFNARSAPTDRDELLALAQAHFDPQLMPRILGVGDTLTSSKVEGNNDYVRGGSDRGFLELVQALGEGFNSNNLVAFVDSSSGELNRPSVHTECLPEQPQLALSGISDCKDPLNINLIFTGGHRQYIDFFQHLAAKRSLR